MPLPEGCRTDRLLLRLWRTGESHAVSDALGSDRGAYQPFLPWTARVNRTIDGCRAFLERQHAWHAQCDPPADRYLFAIVDRSSQASIGGVDLGHIRFAAHQAEIGCWIRADGRGGAVGREAVAALASWAFRPADEGGWRRTPRVAA